MVSFWKLRPPTTVSGLFTLYLGGALLLLSLVFGMTVQQGVRTMLEGAMHDKARALARQLAVVSLDAVITRDYGTLERYVADLVHEPDILFIAIERGSGDALGVAESERAGEDAARPARVEEPIVLLRNEIGRVIVEYDTRRVHELIGRLTLAGIVGNVLLALLLFVVARRLLARRVIEPIRALAWRANPLNEGGNAAAPPIPAGPQPLEVAQLADTFERLRGDIETHLQQVEEANRFAREATERLCREHRLAAIGQLSASLAHGLNTPLGNILCHAQMARESLQDTARLGERLDVIERQATTCSEIVRNLLTAAHAPEPSGRPVDVAALAHAVVQLVQPLLRRHGIGHIEVAGSAPCMALADPSALEHVLFNLMSNAARAGAKNLMLRSGLDDEHACLEVEDDGGGIAPEMQPRLFEAFATTRPAGEGTGLGLYICATLLRAMHGDIELLHSRPGSTCFRLRLPRADDGTTT